MIELDGQVYPSEVRQSQPVALESQEVPAGSSEFPGLSEELSLGRDIVEGSVVEHGDVPQDIDSMRLAVGAMSGVTDYLRNPPALSPRVSAANEGEDYDGTLSDPGGSGAPMPRPSVNSSVNAPKLEASDLPWQPGEAEMARALLAEMQALGSDRARVSRFVRYPDDKRVMLVYTDNEESRSIQRQY
ncbi:MAG: hypothetical protein HC933_04565 [Pleurocapsa sp. SU_196_0]|nr:hypothetical protein [Pleurocapsa sp. SU_196_0]